MDILNFIEKPTKRIPEQIQVMKESKLPLCLYGNSKGALNVFEKLLKFNVKIDKVLVGKDYYISNSKFKDIEIDLFELYKQKNNKFNIFIGFDVKKFKSLFEGLIHSTNICNIFMFSPFCLSLSEDFKKLIYTNKKIIVIDNYYEGLINRELNYKYFIENVKEFQDTYDMLEDNLSKNTFINYLKGHINLTSLPMEKVFVDNQYFCRDIVQLSENEVFVDCGGYIGDTIESFVINTTGKYKRIYVFEPDSKVYSKLMINIAGLQNIEPINKGAYNKSGKVEFYNDESGSSSIDNIFNFSEKIEIEVDKIDDIIKDNVTMIKMDIEGVELEALEGAKNVIINNKPKLAICVYHKKEDLIAIPQYLKKIVPEYKFYLRAHMEIASEVVLYAII